MYEEFDKLAKLPWKEFDAAYPPFVKRASSASPLAKVLLPAMDKVVKAQRHAEVRMAMLLAGVALVFAALWWRYRRDAWRVIVPTLLAGSLTLAVLALLGYPLQLFNVLALMLLLGMGIDYGIFLLEHRGDPSAWLAVCVGAASTWLSFGLLAWSATPALRAFGLTLLLGIGLVWIISPLFRPRALREGPDCTSTFNGSSA